MYTFLALVDVCIYTLNVDLGTTIAIQLVTNYSNESEVDVTPGRLIPRPRPASHRLQYGKTG